MSWRVVGFYFWCVHLLPVPNFMIMPFLRRWLLVPALLLPQMAHADALGAVGLGRALADVLALIAVLVLGVMVVAYRRDAPAALLLLLGMSYFFGQFPTREWLIFGRINPYGCLCLPLGTWLYGVIRARRARREDVQLAWMGVAIIGLCQLPELRLEWAISRVMVPGVNHLEWLAVYYPLKIVLALGSWWVVLRQLRLVGGGTWWQPWWRAPAVVAGVGAICWGGFEVMRFQEISSSNVFLPWASIGWRMLEDGALGLVAGALALRLIPPPTAARVAANTMNPGQ